VPRAAPATDGKSATSARASKGGRPADGGIDPGFTSR